VIRLAQLKRCRGQSPRHLYGRQRKRRLTRERVRQIELESLRRLATLREMQYISV